MRMRRIKWPVSKKGSPYLNTEHRVPELIQVLGSQPASDLNHKPDGRLPLLSAKPAVTPTTLKWVDGSKTFTFLESTNPICLFTIQILWDHDDYKGSFTLEPSNIKTVFRREYSKSREMGSQMAVFGLVSPTYDRETDRQTDRHRHIVSCGKNAHATNAHAPNHVTRE